MPLVEIIRGEKTGDEAIARTVAYALAMGKKPVVVNDCPGFLVNRILMPYFGAFMGLVKRGVDFATIDPGAVNYADYDPKAKEIGWDYVLSVTHTEIRYFFDFFFLSLNFMCC